MKDFNLKEKIGIAMLLLIIFLNLFQLRRDVAEARNDAAFKAFIVEELTSRRAGGGEK